MVVGVAPLEDGDAFAASGSKFENPMIDDEDDGDEDADDETLDKGTKRLPRDEEMGEAGKPTEEQAEE